MFGRLLDLIFCKTSVFFIFFFVLLTPRDPAAKNSVDEFQGIDDDLREWFCIPSRVQCNIPVF